MFAALASASDAPLPKPLFDPTDEGATKLVTPNGADVVMLAGAPLAGLATKLRERVPVPLVDGIQAAVTMAEGLVRLNPRKATMGTYRRPGPKDSTGLGKALADVIAHRDR